MGVINHDLRRIKALFFDVDGVLSCNTIPMNDDGVPMRTVNIKDGYALHMAAVRNVPMAIITGGNTPQVIRRFVSLGLKEDMIILRASRKIEHYRLLRDRLGLKDEEILFVGDDIPDLEVLRVCGLPCCPRDAAWEVKQVCRYISDKDGGMGVARDIVEQYLKANGLWLDTADAFGW